ncbi:MAG: hypothetical protein KDD33_00220 [Bdellovibrionales bacterium]|nr:hypothetical protein [Bdellovibrionales bacterium]
MKVLGILVVIMVSLVSCTKKSQVNDDTIYGVIDANIKGLDPIQAADNYMIKAVSQIYEGLYHYHYLKRPLQLEPQLAESLPTISPDGLTYTIKIKKGVYFQDHEAFPARKGRELTAHDFIYSWKRLADASHKATGWWVFDGRIQGLNEWRQELSQGKVNYDSPISGLTAKDKYTLEIKLTKAFPLFEIMLALPPTFAVAREVVEKTGNEFLNHPVGTGPFLLKEWIRNSKIVLEANPNYRTELYPNEGEDVDRELSRLEDAGKKLPLAKKVVIQIMPERQPMWLSFARGELDHAIIPKDNYSQVFNGKTLREDIRKKGIQILNQPRPDVTFIGINMEHPILGKNKYLRQAMAMAINNQISIDTFYNGRGIPAQSPLPPGFRGYKKSYKKPYDFDLQRAQSYMIKAGFPDGKGLPTFRFELTNASSWSRQMGEFLQQQWAQIGIKIKLIPNNWPQFDKKLKSRQAEIFFMAWTADYPDSENFLQLFFSKNISPGPNNFNFVNRDYDQMYEKMSLLSPSPERLALIRKMVQLVNEEVPAIFLLHRVFRLPYQGWLRNYKEYPGINDFYQYLRIDLERKSKLKPKL